jgi:hypothetical protein
MAYAVIHHFAGGTEDEYNAALAAVHPPHGLPAGQTLHIAGPTDDGWVIIAIHESKASWENFRDNDLGPKMAAGIEGSFTAPPKETAFEVHHHEEA